MSSTPVPPAPPPTITIASLRAKFPHAPESFFRLQANAGNAFDPAFKPGNPDPGYKTPEMGAVPANSVEPDPLIDTCESASQQAVVRWWAVAHFLRYGLKEERLLMAFPLQGKRTDKNGARLVAEGMRKGTPDMFLAVARGSKHGLWIENKHDDGRASAEQRSLLEALDDQKYAVAVCYTAAHAINTIHDYLSQPCPPTNS